MRGLFSLHLHQHWLFLLFFMWISLCGVSCFSVLFVCFLFFKKERKEIGPLAKHMQPFPSHPQVLDIYGSLYGVSQPQRQQQQA